MSNLYEIPAAKALMGAAFIQYLVYSVFYILEGAKLEEFEKNGKLETQQRSTPKRQNNQEENKQENEDVEENGKPADLKDIALEEGDSTQQEPVSQQQQNIANETFDEVDEYDCENANFIVRMSKSYQKSTIWFMLVCALATVRAASGLTIAMAYIHLVCRVIQLIGAVLNKRRLSQVGYILATIMIIIMFFAVMVEGGSYEDFF